MKFFMNNKEVDKDTFINFIKTNCPSDQVIETLLAGMSIDVTTKSGEVIKLQIK